MDNNTIIIENEGLRKTLTLNKDRIVSSEIYNKISSLTVKAQQGSEEFILKFKTGLFSKPEIKASELKVTSTKKELTDDGIIYTIIFAPFKVADSKLNAKLIYNLRNDSTFMYFPPSAFRKRM